MIMSRRATDGKGFYWELAMGAHDEWFAEKWARQEGDRSRSGGGGVSEQELADIAARLGGEVVDSAKGMVRFRASGCGIVTVRVSGPTNCFVYNATGSKGVAYAFVRQRLGVSAPTAVDAEVTQRSMQRIMREVRPAAGTPVEAYLRSRAITILPPLVQYHPKLWHKEAKTYWPGMVVERTNSAGDVVALHRTFLTEDGAKAPVDPVRKDLGRWTGTAIRLSGRVEEVLLGEGIETVLSAMQMTGLPGWATGSAGALRMVVLPPWVRRVIILVDMDDKGDGERAACAVCARLTAEDRVVELKRAPHGKDFNNVLMEMHND
jgi:hypothetical protein